MGVDGVIATNTTTERAASLRSARRSERGGLSGKPLFERSTAVLRSLYRALDGRLPRIGVGGVDGAETAYAKILAGASLVQLYTGFAYGGPALIGRLKRELLAALVAEGFADVTAAIGADLR